MFKPTSQPCIRNQEPIYQLLKHEFKDQGSVLELACGTAQHAVYFAERLTHLIWQPSDLAPALLGANIWLAEAALENIKPSIILGVDDEFWDTGVFDYIYSANLVHFISMESVESMFSGVSKHLKTSGLLALYGPYNQNGFTSEGNLRLDEWLKADVNPVAGIKELSDITNIAMAHGLQLETNHKMPANNHLLIFRKINI